MNKNRRFIFWQNDVGSDESASPFHLIRLRQIELFFPHIPHLSGGHPLPLPRARDKRFAQ
jgi:hypothetical protein